MERSNTTAKEHLDSLPADVRADMKKLDSMLTKVMGRKKTVWTGKFWGGTDQAIIGYGDYRSERPGKPTVEWFMVGLAAQKNYLSVYVNAAEDGTYLAQKYKDRLGKVKVGSSSISFRKLEDVDLDVLLELVGQAKAQLDE